MIVQVTILAWKMLKLSLSNETIYISFQSFKEYKVSSSILQCRYFGWYK